MRPVILNYDEFGDSDAKPLVILHGFFASSRNWRSVAGLLAQRYRVFVPDLRNHGTSPHAQRMDYQSMAVDLNAFLERHGIESPHLLGHSMGGKTAMWFALNCPDNLDRLVVADISPTRYQHSFDHIIEALRAVPLQEIMNRKEAEDVLEGEIPDASYRQFLLQNLQLKNGEYGWRVDLDIFRRTADNIVAFPDSKNVPPYTGEALFLGGGNSDYIRAEDVFRLFPNADIETIPNTGHWLHVQAPQQFCATVDAFLTQ